MAKTARARVRSIVPMHERDPMHGFNSEGDFFNAVMAAGRTGYVDERLIPLRATAGSDEQSGIADEYGGFAVPKSIAGETLTTANELDPTIGRARPKRDYIKGST